MRAIRGSSSLTRWFGGDVQSAAQLLGVDPAAAAEGVEPAPERGLAGLLVDEDDGAGLGYFERAERWSAGGDRDAGFEEPVAFGRFPLADGGGERLVDDQVFDEPAGRAGVGLGEQVGLCPACQRDDDRRRNLKAPKRPAAQPWHGSGSGSPRSIGTISLASAQAAGGPETAKTLTVHLRPELGGNHLAATLNDPNDPVPDLPRPSPRAAIARATGRPS